MGSRWLLLRLHVPAFMQRPDTMFQFFGRGAPAIADDVVRHGQAFLT